MDNVGYRCDCCQEVFRYAEEVVFLNGDNEVLIEEDGDDGDIDTILCLNCYIDD